MQPYRFLPALGKQLVGWKVGISLVTFAVDIIALAAWNASSLGKVAGNGIVIASLCLRMTASVSLQDLPPVWKVWGSYIPALQRHTKLILAQTSQVLQIPLVYMEFFRRYQASPLFPLYLTIVTICDIARVRTFALTILSVSPLFFASFVTGFACRSVSWVLETAPKGAFVERAEGDKVITAEETSSFFAKLFITCVDPVLLKGFRQDLTLSSLGAIQSRYESEHLLEVGDPLWRYHV